MWELMNCLALGQVHHYYPINRCHHGMQQSLALRMFEKRNWGFQEWEAVLHYIGIKSKLFTVASKALSDKASAHLSDFLTLQSPSLHWCSSCFSDQPTHCPLPAFAFSVVSAWNAFHLPGSSEPSVLRLPLGEASLPTMTDQSSFNLPPLPSLSIASSSFSPSKQLFTCFLSAHPIWMEASLGNIHPSCSLPTLRV